MKPFRGSSTIVATNTRICARTMEEIEYTIPETSPTRHISGMAALNIISARGTGGGYELGAFLKPRKNTPRAFLWGQGESINPLPYLGFDGIFDCGPLLRRMGVIDRDRVVLCGHKCLGDRRHGTWMHSRLSFGGVHRARRLDAETRAQSRGVGNPLCRLGRRMLFLDNSSHRARTSAKPSSPSRND